MASSPGETNIPIGDWTIGSLKIYHDAIIGYEREINNERDRRYQERWQAQEVAGARYQEVSNEFRGSLDDLSSKMATKTELASATNNLVEKIETQALLLAEIRSRLDKNPEVRKLETQEATRSGVTQGTNITWGKISAAVGVAGVIGGLVARFF